MPLVAAVVLSALASYWSTSINHVWWLAWLAPVPLLIVLPRERLGRSAAAVAIASIVASLNLVLAYPALPTPVKASIVASIAVANVAVFLLWRLVARRSGAVAAVLAYPAIATALEFLNAQLSVHGSAGAVGYSQTDLLPLMQVAAVTGIHGVSFLVALGASMLAGLWRFRNEPATLRRVLVLGALPIALALVGGAIRLLRPAGSEATSIGLLAEDAAMRHFDEADSALALPLLRRYVARGRSLAERGATVLVLPEKLAGIAPSYAADARAILAELARSERVTVVAGLNLLDRKASPRNVALAFGPDGSTVVEYDKRHMVPGLESRYRLGAGPGLFPENHVGVAICKDLDFAGLGREYANAGTGLMLVPAWDFTTDAWIHSRMAVVRGIEGGFAVARSAAEGRLTLSDGYGRVLGETASGPEPGVLLGWLPSGPGATFYARWGNWFGWVTVGLAGVLLAAAAIRPRAA